MKHSDTYYAVPTEQKAPTINEAKSPRSPKRYDDIGPLDDESGMPLAFRQVCFEMFDGGWVDGGGGGGS